MEPNCEEGAEETSYDSAGENFKLAEFAVKRYANHAMVRSYTNQIERLKLEGRVEATQVAKLRQMHEALTYHFEGNPEEIERILNGAIELLSLEKIGKKGFHEAKNLMELLTKALPYVLDKKAVPGIDEKVIGTGLYDRQVMDEFRRENKPE